MTVRVRVAVFLVLACAVGNTWSQEDTVPNPFGGAPLEAIPYPDLDVLQESVRDSLRDARELFEEERARAQSARDLGLAYGRLGMHYQAHELQDPAGASYRNATLLVPEDARWFYYLGFHYHETGRFDEAITAYRRALALQPDYLPLQVRLGLSYLEDSQFDEARTVFEAVLARQSDQVAALAGLGRVAFQNQDYEQAIEYFQRALETQPAANELNYRLGMAYRQTGDIERAREYLEKRGKVSPQFQDPLLRVMQGRSRSSQFYLQQGIAAGKEGNFEGAVNALTVAVAVNPKDDAAHVALGLALEQLDRLDEAGMHYEQALELNPQNEDAAFNLGVLLHQEDLVEPAAAYYQQAVDINADYTQAWYLLGHAHMQMARHEEAAGDFAEVARLQSDNVHVLNLQAVALLGAARCEKAMTVAERALVINPSRGDALQIRARAVSTCPAASEELRRTALADARALYDLRPNMEHSETLAMASAALGNFQDAIDFQTQAIFEAFKLGGLERFPGLAENMERYRNRQPAVRAWHPEHPVFSPDPFEEDTPGPPESAGSS